MQARKTFLWVGNALFNCVLLALLLGAGAYSAFALWDNQRIYAAAGDVQSGMIKLKPEITLDADDGPDFSDLLKINPDVCAWLTMDGTAIDLPVLQGDTNFTYINTDVYGNFALAGSLFLDSRSSRDFTDPYSLIYGHHMADHKMFGDLDLYKDEAFFAENRTGLLILPGSAYQLEVLSCLLVGASEEHIFDPTRWQDHNISALMSFIKQNALHLNEDLMNRLSSGEMPRLLCLSTCSSEFTDARTIVLTVMKPYQSEELGGQSE